jgi:Protein of unknown function DUF262/Protein of unknown function (DUF1524)
MSVAAVSLSPIEAHERTICEVLSDSYAFEIPSYQRPYAWELDQARELLSDITGAMDNAAASGGIYFLGSIVLIKLPNDAQAKVIDGQQRLTTLTILLSVLRDLTTEQETRIERRSYIFQKGSPDRGTKDQYRLLLRERDRAFFLKYVQKPDATNSLPEPAALRGSEQRIAENARYFRAELEAMPEDRRNKLIQFLLQRCYLVVVAVPTAQAARRIFTVLNARGLDLTATDILKANLLERVTEPHDAELAKRWEAVEDALGRDSFVELFAHIRMIYERDKPRIALEDGFPAVVSPFNGDCNAFVSDLLEPLADAYVLLSGPIAIQQQFGADCAKAVRSLHRLDNKDWMPPALLRLWKRTSGDASDVSEFLIELERLAYFLFVTRADVNDRMARFAAVMDEFQPRANKPVPLAGLSLSAEEQTKFISALSGPIYQLTRVCKPVLQRLDESLASGGATYDTLVSIEHVLPQTVDKSGEWGKTFPDESSRKEWTHRLGNLVLLTRRINSAASNWDFKTKKEKYFQSKAGATTFALTLRVLQKDTWTLAELEQNQKELIGKLEDVWQLAASQPAASQPVPA